jgi:flavin-dependent dehydrogenase
MDVLIVGAGPSGAVAGLLLARAGARVVLLDRATFPRDKLCGDTVNPGTLATLRRLGVAREIETHGLRVDGMLVTGEDGAAIEGRYADGLHGRAIVRRELDWILLQRAVSAGCRFEPRTAVRGAIVEERDGARVVTGVTVGANGATRVLRAPVVIAADGRRSTLAFGLGLARHPRRPRRWAIGGYFEGAPVTLSKLSSLSSLASLSSQSRTLLATLGEMHVRKNRYIGVAPVPGGLTNVCLVKPSSGGDADLRRPAEVLRRELANDPQLRDRFASARLVTPPVVLGPLAVDVSRETIDGLLLAGDAAGFIDPITGDGLCFAVRGGELAANAALRALERGWAGVHADLAAARARAFGGKQRFNRTLRVIVSSPRAIAAAAVGARIAPVALRAIIARAGDCAIARRT